MRLVRIAALCALIVAVVLGASAALIIVNQSRIVGDVLASVRKRTGVDIIPRAISVHLGTHLIVVLDQPQVIANGHEIVKLKSLRAIISYHSIFVRSGLPLYRLTATSPEITLPVASSDAAAVPMPRPGAQTISALQDVLHALARIAWRVDTIDATVRYADGAELANHVGIVAYRSHREPFLWRLGFKGSVLGSPVSEAQISGKIVLGTGKHSRPGEFAHGQLWTWDVPLNGIEAEGFGLAGAIQGSLKFSLHDDGSMTGEADAGAQKLLLKSQRLAAPVDLGDYSLHAGFDITGGKYAVTQIVLRRVNTAVLSGGTELLGPQSGKPELGIHVGGFHFDAAAAKQALLSGRHLPSDLVDMLNRLRPGKVTVGDATLSATLDEIETAPLDAIRKNLVVTGTIEDVGFTIPTDTKLPPVENLSAQLGYSKGLLTISQGTAKFGKSALRDLAANANLGNGIAGADYKISVNVDADLAELYPAIAKSLDLYQLKERDRLERLSGRVDMVATASGKLSAKTLDAPKDYQVRADAIGAVLTIKGSPGPLKVSRGTVTINPGSIKFDHLMLAVSGPIGGKVVVNSDPGNPGAMTPEGKLTLAKGGVKFNFLRAPIMVQGATLTMRHKQLVLSMPGSKLEDQAINFRVTVPDYTHPSIRIDATLQKLDLEVMNFVRMPWSPATPPIHFEVPCSGHIEARAGNLAAFQMTDLKTDFTRTPAGDWHVYNMSATAYRGKMKLDLTGRAPDNWIHMMSSATDMDPAPLFMLSGKNQQSPLLGHLFLAIDLWANTDTNFFETLAGDLSVTIRDGTLDKFTLLSRLLSFIDIKIGRA